MALNYTTKYSPLIADRFKQQSFTEKYAGDKFDFDGAQSIPDVSDTIGSEVAAASLASGNLPGGGMTGQVLVKRSDASYDLTFSDLPKNADTLKTARTIQTDLASTAAADFDGSSNILPGVTGILPPANGGTGTSSSQGAALALGRGSCFCTTDRKSTRLNSSH